MEYYTGMAVNGMGDQPAYDELGEGVMLTSKELRMMKAKIVERGLTHKQMASKLGMEVSNFRPRLYGKRLFTERQLSVIERALGRM